MTAVVAAETVLLLVLVVLVAGVLRSHAEILRRLGSAEDEPLQVREPASTAPRQDTRAAPLAGVTPSGDALSLAFERPGSVPTLLAFLTSGCSTCAGFWETLSEPRLPPGVQTVIVAKDSDQEQPAKLRALSPNGIPVIMSSRAWSDYNVPGAPYFVFVDGGIRGEGIATSWHALSSLVRDAVADQREAERRTGPTERAGRGPGERTTRGSSGRARTIDETLAAAGIGPDDPSLHPSRVD